MINIKQLRTKGALQQVPNKPGYYKWWANQDDFKTIIDKLDVQYGTIEPYLDKSADDALICIYIGIAAKESLRKRLDWHINDPHTESRVKNGTLSTLRQSISSVIKGNQFDKDATNDFMNRLYIEWFEIDAPIKSEKAKMELHTVECTAMKNYLYVLNIQDNKHKAAKPIKTQLKLIRKKSK